MERESREGLVRQRGGISGRMVARWPSLLPSRGSGGSGHITVHIQPKNVSTNDVTIIVYLRRFKTAGYRG